jgi:AhpD family alkylhydroperoxidase
MTDDVQLGNRRLDASGNEALIGMARMGADAFGYKADLRIDRGLAKLLRLRVSQLNNCTCCLNLHYQAAREAGIPRAKIDTLTAWWETELHSEADQAALRYAEALTRVADTRSGRGVSALPRRARRALQPGGDARDRRCRRQNERLDPDQTCRGRDAGPGGLSSFRSSLPRGRDGLHWDVPKVASRGRDRIDACVCRRRACLCKRAPRHDGVVSAVS